MKGLLERLRDGDSIVIAEGYLWEIERRGFAQFGSQVPVVVLEKPDEVETLHEEFALAGSDVIEAFTYFGHREYMKRQGREDELEKLNRDALSIARKVADKYGKLMAGGLSNTPLYSKMDKESHQKIYDMFKEQVIWCVEGGADYIIGETFDAFGEAELALRAIMDHGKGCPAVITMAAHIPDRTTDDIPITEALKRLEGQGAAVVGLNCSRGPDIMMPLLREIRNVCKGPIAAIPVPYRTTEKERTFYAIKDPKTGKCLYPHNLDQVRSSREEIRKFAEDAKSLGVQYVGLCCGNYPSLIREVSEVYGKKPPASKYSMKGAWISGETPKNEIVKTIRKFMVGDE
ncbi:betaine--homocysteine S-methyltransferase 1-like [Mercenaria mercenaria]|uniref:betaine--homocysteine S-methyltransferase 1-like n=1 Tax=Mercenaria mercenaria TaxID=6596 RepID=UPI00234F2A25|nr:betaine--homocysteine S-methyltransferase 1-like [Mercenaria mercenaria]